jgi:sugar lactone lactonase YvrE
MRLLLLCLSVLASIFSYTFAVNTQEEVDFQIVKKFYTERPANLAVSSKGEIFATMHPMEEPRQKVVKITKNGEIIPFFSGGLSAYKGRMENSGIVNTIGISITKQDILWVLDMGGKVEGKDVSPKFIVWDINKNKLVKIITIPSEVLASNSFLQDFAIDEKNNFAFIADMTIGGNTSAPAIIVMNLETLEAKRVLQNNKMLIAAKPLIAEGVEVGKLGVNPISIDPQNEWIYFGVMNKDFAYRIKAKELASFSSSDVYLASKIEKYGEKPDSDGFKVDENGNIYVGDVANSEIGVITKTGYRKYVKSSELYWVDGLAIGNDGFIYAVVNQLNRHKNFAGTEKGKKPYLIIKFKKL